MALWVSTATKLSLYTVENTQHKYAMIHGYNPIFHLFNEKQFCKYIKERLANKKNLTKSFYCVQIEFRKKHFVSNLQFDGSLIMFNGAVIKIIIKSSFSNASDIVLVMRIVIIFKLKINVENRNFFMHRLLKYYKSSFYQGRSYVLLLEYCNHSMTLNWY